MARRDERPKLPVLAERPSWFVQCAANSDCKASGRMWIRTLERNQRLCVDHYYRASEADHSLAFDEPVPPKFPRIPAKPVAGD